MKFLIETDRYILREILETDISGMYDLESDPEVHKYLGNKPVKSIDQTLKVINYIRDQYETYGIGRWAVIEKSSGEFVGWSGLKYETVVRDDMNYYDIGYRLRQKFWGQGIATETAKAALKYGFETMKLDEVYGGAHVENIGSNKVLKKMGMNFIEEFDYAGLMHNWYRLDKRGWQDPIRRTSK